MLGTEVLVFLRCLAAKVLIQVKCIAEGEHSAILWPSLSYHLSLRSLSIFEWQFSTGFTVTSLVYILLMCDLSKLSVTMYM